MQFELEKDSLCFTYCQVPVIYKLAEQESLKVVFANDSIQEFEDPILDFLTSKKIFKRTGEIKQIIVSIK